MVNQSRLAKQVLEVGAEVSAFLYAHPEITARLPERYRLVVLLLDDPEALAWALEGEGGPGAEPVVYALVRGGKVQGLLTPGAYHPEGGLAGPTSAGLP